MEKVVKNHNILTILCLVVFLFSILMITTSTAYFSNQKNTFDSSIKMGEIAINDNTNTFNYGYKGEEIINLSNVYFTNNGKNECAVRAYFGINWEDNSDSAESFEISDNWKMGNDGYFYYNKKLKPNESSDLFVNAISFKDNGKIGKNFTLQIYCEAVQTAGDLHIKIFNNSPIIW